ncbi:uncharacterized protein LOC131806343 [Musca domestica]|uniref:Uncharacterized protein LOC131802702 n=1 Tax=Musca domestica TaxID=7370 RepID=A0ABM3UZZ0_MUSDO|nr:uncharacterized protein LOC131802702 [Musca domestica]XP_058986332.1 uncharacterized protein LOC131806343 [Musca domestica]
MNMGQGEVCQVCYGIHHLRNCPAFQVMTVEQRESVVLARRYCKNCLGRNHVARFCSWPGTCRMCGSRHNTMLHRPVVAGLIDSGIGFARYHPYANQRAQQTQQQQQILAQLQTRHAHTVTETAPKQKKRKQHENKQQIGVQKTQTNNKHRRDKTIKKQNKKQNQHAAQQPQQQPGERKREEKPLLQQPEMMDRFLSVLEKIATALTVAPVQGARHVGNRPNPIDDDIDMDLIDLDN